jgi:hypothetical protein
MVRAGRAVVILASALAFAACDGSETRPSASPQASSPSGPAAGVPERAERAARVPSIPHRSKVYFGAMEGSRAEVTRAIEDLKTVDLWEPLTEHLYRIDLRVRAGEEDVPQDAHLADARFWKSDIAHGTYRYPKGAFCRIRFFPAAMEADLVRWSSYFARGLLTDAPPTIRQFWAAILGHELSHCPAKGTDTTPEEVALAWERRVLAALRAAGVE